MELNQACLEALPGESIITTMKNVLLVIGTSTSAYEMVKDPMVTDFCGQVKIVPNIDEEEMSPFEFANMMVYLCGDVSKLANRFIQECLENAVRIRVIADKSDLVISEKSIDPLKSIEIVTSGQVPILINGVGMFYREMFKNADLDQEFADYFDCITKSHTLQGLRESSKPGIAHRTGIYMTPVKTVVRADGAKENHFRLLRCSTNLQGPTCDFRAIDQYLVDTCNEECSLVMKNNAAMNHVLAQAYWNKYVSKEEYVSGGETEESRKRKNVAPPPAETNALECPETVKKDTDVGGNMTKMRQVKAKIKRHADKTKDMPKNGVMAFCTFYKDNELQLLHRLDNDFDWGHISRKNGKTGPFVSGLTRLRFEMKPSVWERMKQSHTGVQNLVRKFDVTLYPNSVFMMPLSTNRIYTHEIIPGRLDVAKLPTRLGYVVRCSNSECVSLYEDEGPKRNTSTFLKTALGLKKLEPVTHDGMLELKRVYTQENTSDKFMEEAYGTYQGKFMFSLNQGDYMEPIIYGDDAVTKPTSVSAGSFKGFRIFNLDPNTANAFRVPTLFNDLEAGISWENTGKGRKGDVLVKPQAIANDDGTISTKVPIVRTTTRYSNAAHVFSDLHENLVKEILACATAEGIPINKGLSPNNGLIEKYNSSYKKMGFHSDQAQDLIEGSWIFLYSCYRHPELVDPNRPPRKLVIEKKEIGDVSGHHRQVEIPMAHNSVIAWSLPTNSQFRHKIILDLGSKRNEWLGITLRTSKMLISPSQNSLNDNLRVAKAEERKEFYCLRRRENEEINFKWPELPYTISSSDLLEPI